MKPNSEWRRDANSALAQKPAHILLVGLLACFGLLIGVQAAPASAWPASGYAPSAGRVSARRISGSRLRIVIGALPSGLSARILVSGAHGVRQTVTHSSTLKLSPGSYVISCGPVPGSAGSYYATIPRMHEHVRAGRQTTVTVSYATLVPNTTRVVPASGTVALEGEPSGPRVLTLTGPAAAGASVGQFLSSGQSSAAPDGYLVKVVGVEHAGANAVLRVENATLLEALPSGEINTEQTLEPAATSASNSRGAMAARADSSSGDFWAHVAGLKCKPTHELNVPKPQFSIHPSLAFHVKWGFLKIDSATLTANLTEKLSMSASASGGAECETKAPGAALLPHPIKLAPFDIPIGPLQLVIEPQVQLYLSGKASITAKVSASLEQEASATVGAAYENGSFRPIRSYKNSFKPSVQAEGNAQAEIAVRPTLEMLAYGVGGPTFDLGVAAKLSANTTSNPWWKLQGCLQAGVGIKLSVLVLNWEWSNPRLFEFCKTVLTATTPAPGAGGSTGGGGGKTGGGGKEEKGELCKKYETVGFETKCVSK